MDKSNQYNQYKADTCEVVDFFKKVALDRRGIELARRPTLRVREIELLVTIVCCSGVRIPRRVLRCLERAIAIRERFEQFYAALSIQDGKRDDMKHQHFIEMLKRIRHRMTSSTQIQTNQAKEQPTPRDLPSREVPLDEREVYDESEEQSQEKDESVQEESQVEKTALDTDTQSGMEPEDSNAEAIFAVWCFLEALVELKDHLHTVWSDYYEGKLSLATAAKISDVGFELVHKEETAFVARWPEYERHQQIFQLMGSSMLTFERTTVIRTAITRDFTMQDKSMEAYLDRQRLLMVDAFRIAHDFCALLPRNTSVAQHLHESIRDNVKTFHPLAEMLYSIVANFSKSDGISSSERESSTLFLDGFTRSLARLYETSAIRPSTVLSFQLHMEIFGLLGENGYKGCFEALQIGVDKMSTTIKNHLEWMKRNTKNPSSEKDRPLLAMAQKQIDELASVGASPRHDEPKVLFSALPLLCGNVWHNLRTLLHLDGIDQSNEGFALLAAAYLYQGARLCGSLTTRWPSMDFIIDKHPFLVFGVDRSYTPMKSLARHYCLSLGAKVETLAPGTSYQLQHALPSVKTILQSARKVQTPLPHLLETLRVSGDAPSEAALQQLSKRQGTSKSNNSAVDLLRLMHASLVKHEVALNFNYAKFWEETVDSLWQCYTKLSRKHEAWSSTFTDTWNIEFVHSVLMEAVYAEETKTDVHATMLGACAHILGQRLAARKTIDLFNFAKEDSSGCIPDATKPCNHSPRPPHPKYGNANHIPKEWVSVPNATLNAEGMMLAFDPRSSILISAQRSDRSTIDFQHMHWPLLILTSVLPRMNTNRSDGVHQGMNMIV